MSRIVVLIVVLLLVIGGIVFLSRVPSERPVKTIEMTVPQGGNAR
jgi:hypothetical protein